MLANADELMVLDDFAPFCALCVQKDAKLYQSISKILKAMPLHNFARDLLFLIAVRIASV